MAGRLKRWTKELNAEFGLEIEILRIDPDELWSDSTSLPFMEKVDALADWYLYNEEKKVPLITCEGKQIEKFDDLARILQIGD